MATILKKVTINKERIDLLFKASRLHSQDANNNNDFDAPPLEEEDDFQRLNEKLLSDAVFQNKFWRRKNNAEPLKKRNIAVRTQKPESKIVAGTDNAVMDLNADPQVGTSTTYPQDK